MREIKFRAWDKDTKTMADWDVLTSLIEGRKAHAVSKLEVQEYKSRPELVRGVIYEGNPFKMDNLIFMQFTGLRDADGIEAYKDDLVRDWENIDTYQIVWSNHWACFELKRLTNNNDTELDSISDVPMSGYIIGNIYENPELLPRTG